MRTIYRALAGLFGAVIAIGGCSDGDGLFEPEYGIAAEYGVPHARYNISGRVLEQASGAAIAGIEVRLHGELADTTAADGSWRIEGQTYYAGLTPELNVHDIDGPANGSYDDHAQRLALDQTAPAQDDWNAGLFEQHLLDIALPESHPAEDAE